MDLCFEKRIWKKGFKTIVGLDEAGRGPLAGPVTAAAVTIQQSLGEIKGVNDSKKLSPQKRKQLLKVLTNHPLIDWQVSWVAPKVIDRINIFEATKLAMRTSVLKLEKATGKRADFLFIDGNFKIGLDRNQLPVKQGDQKVFVCACASIIAKVFRDRTMKRYHKLFPEYGFDRHKGYGTELHRKKLLKHGPCRIHRFSFKPVSQLMQRS